MLEESAVGQARQGSVGQHGLTINLDRFYLMCIVEDVDALFTNVNALALALALSNVDKGRGEKV